MRLVSALLLASAGLTAAFAPIKVGQSLPAANLHSGFPPEMVSITDYAKGKNMIIVGLPGAFTPT
jgi:peroxiredoxin